ncbi:helix-turn-helix domain-containing protein [Pediococcus pentosaceus]|uniref:helix-turn-helix domain-containing protein n=1 Tax=Pediococcus pentosaceus TaxID=1255 RepID=UPI001366A208|nr:helix-turn-helix transcriptional regulator [Pediococcus pentosaceus]QHM64369.1 hypothetical protein C7M48_00072 [Pediococcus pentosaceus]QHM67834.1 hypothetical protein C7M49_01802 [Pediococcus pentosaceus]QHM68012.1 hypothetical protein C7M50_00074 [Pediococcus pentosaceus]
MMTTFDRINELAKKRGIGLRTLAQDAGLGETTIYGWKRRTPDSAKLKAVAKELHVTVDYLLGKTEKEEPVNGTRDMEVEEALNSMRSYQGQPISDEEREVMRGIIKGYLDNKNKK